jgi:hypothetical protein
MQIFVRALCVLFSLSIALPIAAAAEDRTQTYSGQIPSSTQTNQQTRDDRTALGVFARDVLGAAATAGTYANLSVVPNGGMYVAVQPTGAGNGSVYQIKPEDPLPLPQNQAVQLSTDTNPIVLIGLQNGPTGGVGPMTAPTSGNSVIYLVEAQISTIDGANQTVTFQNTTGGTNTESLPITRTDKVSYQVVAGTPSSSPTAPAATTGWVAIGTITIPSGTTVITSGMIAPSPPFGGFVVAGGSPSVTGLTITGVGTGCLSTNGSGVVTAAACTSGLGSVVGGYPITASTSGGVANVGCPTCVTSLVSGTGVTTTTGTTPTVGLSHGDYDSLAGNQTITGAKTFTQGLTAPGFDSAAGVIVADDSATAHGLNIVTQPNPTFGVRFFNGNPGSGGTYIAQIDGSGDYTIQPGSSSACMSLNIQEIPSCPTVSNSSEGGMNFDILSSSTLGYRWFTYSSTAGLTGILGLTSTLFTVPEPATIGGNQEGANASSALDLDGDLTLQRGSSNSGVMYFGTTGSDYFDYDGTNFNMNGGFLRMGGGDGIYFGTNTGLGFASGSAAGGISCSAFDIYNQQSPYTTYACTDMTGNLGISGNFYAASQRKLKNRISAYSPQQAINVAMATKIVRYCYKTEHCKPGEHRHIGFIADDTSTDIAPKHKSMDVNATAAVSLGAIQYLQHEIEVLKKRLAALHH